MEKYRNHPLAGATDLDSAMNRLWEFYKKYLPGIYLISVVISLISGVISSSLDLTGIQSTTDPEQVLIMLKSMAVPYLLIVATSLVLGVFLHVWILEKPVEESNLMPVLVKSSLRAIIPLLVTAIFVGIAGGVLVVIGTIILILPGIFAAIYVVTIMVISLPVILIESRDPFNVIMRSLRLTHRNFWSNIAWVIVVGLMIIVISIVFSGILMLPFTGTFLKSFGNPEEATAMLEIARKPLYIIISALVTSLVTPVFPIFAFILYFRNAEASDTELVTPEEDNRVKVEDLYPPVPGSNNE